MKRISRSALVEHSASDIYTLVEAIEDYPGFLPWCIAARVSERTPERTVASMDVGLKGVRQSFSTENIKQPGRGMEMRLIEGPFRSFGAAWRFTPLGERAAKIEFSLSYEFSNRLLAKVLEPVFDHIADTMVDAFIRRADTVYNGSRGPD
jgi:ribosome-associated toxin RatA of RatAB toxin-antitoxin module